MGKMRVNGGGLQVVQYRTGSGNTSSRLMTNQSEDLEVNDSGDKLYLDFCFIWGCGAPTAGPADVLPGDTATASAGLWRGICMNVSRKGKTIYDKCSNDKF